MRERQSKKQFKRKVIAGFEVPVVLLPVLAFFVIATVFFTIEVSTLGAGLAYLEQEEANLIKEKQTLSGELVGASSLNEIGEKAKDLGFIKPSNVIYISEKEAVAKLP
ncbi:MAG: hypothetical protein WBD86_01535 [Microgenomates group bacterium]